MVHDRSISWRTDNGRDIISWMRTPCQTLRQAFYSYELQSLQNPTVEDTVTPNV